MTLRDDTPFRIIELWPIWIQCWVCDVESLSGFGIAVYEDMILPDDYEGEWFGSPVCRRCYDAVMALQQSRPGEILVKHEVKQCIAAAYGIDTAGLEG